MPENHTAYNRIFVTGMFRSGTSVTARALSAHPRLLVVGDPYVYFFKGYRNFLYERAGISEWNPDEPMSDHFLDPHHEVLQEIAAADFSEPIPLSIANKIKSDIVEWKTSQHPRLCERISQVSGETFAAFYDSLIQALHDAYPDPKVEQLGTKACWSEEFIPALARAFPEMRFVILIRDLRAVVASQNSRSGEGAGKRPLLFYIRQWRKSVAFAMSLAKSDLAGRLLVMRYEDLIEDSDTWLTRLCDHLQVDADAAVLDPAQYSDGNETWRPNSSYEAVGGIYRSSRDRWRSVLTPREIAMIDTLAGPELRALEYPTEKPGAVLDFLADAPEPAYEELAAWVRECSAGDYLEDPTRFFAEIAKERLREDLLQRLQPIPSDIAPRMFTNERHGKRLRHHAAPATPVTAFERATKDRIRRELLDGPSPRPNTGSRRTQ